MLARGKHGNDGFRTFGGIGGRGSGHGAGALEINGDLLDHEFTIERDGQTVATISKSWLTMTASYAVEVAPGEDDLLILASVLALDLAIDAEHDH